MSVIPGISDFLLFEFQSPMIKRTSSFGVSSRRPYMSSQNFSTSSALLVGGIDLDYCVTDWFALETNRDHSVVFEIAPKYCILDSC